MKIWVLGFVLAGLIGGASARDTGKHQAKADPARVAAILSATHDEIVSQNDAWFKDGHFLMDVQALQILFFLNPTDGESATNLAWMFENVQDYSNAVATYIQYKDANPKDPNAVLPEAFMYFRQKLYSKVPPLLEPTLKANPKPKPNTYRILAHAYEKLGQWQDALRVYNLYLGMFPKDGTAIHNRDEVLQHLKPKN